MLPPKLDQYGSAPLIIVVVTYWVCNFDAGKCSEVLELKPTEEPIALIPLGYPESDEIPVKKRKGLDELVVWM